MNNPTLEFLKNEAGEQEGLSDAGIETFRDDPYASCAREAGQNSRDAGLNNGKPVRMTFDLIQEPCGNLPFYGSLAAALDCCRSQAHAEKEKDFFKNACSVVSQKTIPVLRISDYNTKGLTGPPEKIGSVFHSLLKSSGISNKDSETSGGSYGIGKNATFAVSDLQTVMYSTLYTGEQGHPCFAAQGKVKLVSHEDENGAHRRATGYWGYPDGFRAITEQALAPDWMKRSEIGTSIFSVGFRDSPKWAERMTYSLVSNFFVAIQKNEMEFEVDSGRIKINSNTLEGLLSRQDIKDAAEESGHLNELEFAGQLYRCLVSEAAIEEVIEIPGLGKLNVRILTEIDMPRRVGFVRNGMLITDNLRNFGHAFSSSRFSGADFIALVQPCDESSGKLLKKLENPAHNAFSAERISDPESRRSAEKAMRNLGKTLRQMITSSTKVQTEDSLVLDELGKFFAYQGNSESEPDPSAENDPETYTYSATRASTQRNNTSAKEVGGNSTGGNKGSSGRGNNGGGGSVTEKSNRRTSVTLEDVRNRLGDTAKRRILYFSAPVSGCLELKIQATGVNTPELLHPVKADAATITGGRLLVDVVEGKRTALSIEFDEAYDGPIEVEAVSSREEIAE
ncbi:hypothetical protein AUR61_014100 [Stutzerimonas balearica]|uniref:hypothetical protein n=1 Tax=Stutzerimonas balearica TaxID=74829 RepID=UPI000970A524|nr:hypothetical protein [Stutzerimonas balearica]OMG63325.1 hypothetical protein AUR61_014100 [Stutzerimonas balearica]